MNSRSFWRMFSSDLAIDLGTANTLVYATGKGIVVDEPSILALNKKTGEVESVGKDAKQMLGRTPAHLTTVKPMRDGVIADFDAAELMLHGFIQKALCRKKMVHPGMIIGVPSDTTEVEKRAVINAAYRANASEVRLVDQAMVAAIGAGLPVTESIGNMVVDIGGGTTDIAVITGAGIVYSRSLRIGGNVMDDSIIEHVKKEHNLLIGEQTAEHVKIEIGSAYPLDTPTSIEVKGRDLIKGLPRTVSITDSEIRRALYGTVSAILQAIRVALECTPPELSGDISDRGIVLTGGSSLLKNLDKRIQTETRLPVALAEDPLTSVISGTAKMLENFQLLRKMAILPPN
jgi:rod shape-determining protein MreB